MPVNSSIDTIPRDGALNKGSLNMVKTVVKVCYECATEINYNFREAVYFRRLYNMFIDNKMD